MPSKQPNSLRQSNCQQQLLHTVATSTLRSPEGLAMHTEPHRNHGLVADVLGAGGIGQGGQGFLHMLGAGGAAGNHEGEGVAP